MFTQDIDTISSAAVNKVDVCNHHTGIFFVRAIMAGFWIVVAILLSNVTASVLYGRYPEIAKVVGALFVPHRHRTGSFHWRRTFYRQQPDDGIRIL